MILPLRAAARALSFVWCLLAAPAWAATFKLALLVPAGDERLSRSRLERALPAHPGGPAADAIKAALAEGRSDLEGSGTRLEFEVIEVADAAATRAAAQRLDKAGAAALLTDLPAAWTLAAADGTKAPVLNIGNTDDRLRQTDCRANLWHLAPSDRMRADALAQWLVARRWSQVLLLVGPDDAERGNQVEALVKRYGLKLVARKPFKLSADPRERDLANPLLLTGTASIGSYDVVWVVDRDGEFASMLPYRTALPRPVVGDAGLQALAWSPRFDRFGAPQVTRRLLKAAGRPMGAHDWPAWLAGKAVVAAAAAATKGSASAFAKALAGAELDGSKGVLMNFRPWDGQLRQPLILSDGIAVMGLAPGEGVLHPKNNLDVLGADAPERLCKARAGG
jgi:ABC transporter substrate binding protein (PQQ-dependent alcohol dehydrogenase system)